MNLLSSSSDEGSDDGRSLWSRSKRSSSSTPSKNISTVRNPRVHSSPDSPRSNPCVSKETDVQSSLKSGSCAFSLPLGRELPAQSSFRLPESFRKSRKPQKVISASAFLLGTKYSPSGDFPTPQTSHSHLHSTVKSPIMRPEQRSFPNENFESKVSDRSKKRGKNSASKFNWLGSKSLHTSSSDSDTELDERKIVKDVAESVERIPPRSDTDNSTQLGFSVSQNSEQVSSCDDSDPIAGTKGKKYESFLVKSSYKSLFGRGRSGNETLAVEERCEKIKDSCVPRPLCSEEKDWLWEGGGEERKSEPSEKDKQPERPHKLKRKRNSPHQPSTVKRSKCYDTPGQRKELVEDESLNESELDLDEEDVWPKLPKPAANTLGSECESTSGSQRKPLVLYTPNETSVPHTNEQLADHKMPFSFPRSIEVCGNLNQFLYDYQRDGIKWLFEGFRNAHGVILGDEMGLGKTVQVIGLLSAILGKKGSVVDKLRWRKLQDLRKSMILSDGIVTFDEVHNPPPILVVVPASLLTNWNSELNRWMCCKVLVLNGPPSVRSEAMLSVQRGNFEFVVCTYHVLISDLDVIQRVPWLAVVLDEMHQLKNPETKVSKAVRAVKCVRKIGLTGTLMQNRHEELHCLLDTIAPGSLGMLEEFRIYYANDIKYARKITAAPEAIQRARMKEQKLRNLLVPYFLQRRKNINPHFGTIEKRDKVVFCQLTDLQLRAYRRVIQSEDFEFVSRAKERCDCGRPSRRQRSQCCYSVPNCEECILWPRFHSNGERCSRCPSCLGLVCIAQLLKLSSHMDLLKADPRDSEEVQNRAREFAGMAFGEDTNECGGLNQASTFAKMKQTDSCGKMVVLEKLLARWKRKREKFVIGKGYEYRRLDGKTKVEERQAVVDSYNENRAIFIFLISTKAGGLGLNITSATNVVLFDPSWNPAHDCQAQDRAYRIGQTKNVQVFRLVSLGTIEEMIYARQVYKQQLTETTLQGKHGNRYFEGVQDDPNQKGELFGLANLLVLNEEGIMKEVQQKYHRHRMNATASCVNSSPSSMEDSFIIQDNLFKYNTSLESAQSATVNSKGSKTQRLPAAIHVDVDEEMAEVAVEVLGLVDAEKHFHLRPEPPVTQDVEKEEDGYLSPSQDLMDILGAKSMSHKSIVQNATDVERSEHHPSSLCDTRNVEHLRDTCSQTENSNPFLQRCDSPSPSPPLREGGKLVDTKRLTSRPSTIRDKLAAIKAKRQQSENNTPDPSPILCDPLKTCVLRPRRYRIEGSFERETDTEKETQAQDSSEIWSLDRDLPPSSTSSTSL